MSAARFRKKPVVVEAIQFDGTIESANQVLAWIGSSGGHALRAHSTKPERGVVIATLEGEMTAAPGWWVIKGVAGEFYPCKPDIFEVTYEAEAGVCESCGARADVQLADGSTWCDECNTAAHSLGYDQEQGVAIDKAAADG